MLAHAENNLNDIQLHLLKMFSIPVEDNILRDVKNLLSDYFFNKLVSNADVVWEQSNYSNEIIDKWIFEDERQLI